MKMNLIGTVRTETHILQFIKVVELSTECFCKLNQFLLLYQLQQKQATKNGQTRTFNKTISILKKTQKINIKFLSQKPNKTTNQINRKMQHEQYSSRKVATCLHPILDKSGAYSISQSFRHALKECPSEQRSTFVLCSKCLNESSNSWKTSSCNFWYEIDNAGTLER